MKALLKLTSLKNFSKNPKIFLLYLTFLITFLTIKISQTNSQHQQQQNQFIDFSLIDDIQNKIKITSKTQYSKLFNETDLSYLEYYYTKKSNFSLIGAYQLRIIDRKLDFLAKIIFIDCDEVEKNDFFDCKKKEEEFPRIKMAVPSQNKFDDKQNLQPYQYINFNKQTVSDKMLYDFISENIVSFSVKLTSENFGFFSNATFFNKVILFTEKKNTPNLFRGLSNYFYDRILFGEIRSDQEELISRFNIKKFPFIIVLENSFYLKEEQKVHFYDGPMYASDIKKFVDTYALKEKFYMVRMEDLRSFGKINFLEKLNFDGFFEENKQRNKIVYFHNDENGYNDVYTTPESVKELAQISK